MERHPLLKQSIFDFGSNPYLRDGPPYEADESWHETVTLAPGGFKLLAGSCDIDVVEGDVRVESVYRDGEIAIEENGEFVEAIKIIAGSTGCTLSIQHNRPKKMY